MPRIQVYKDKGKMIPVEQAKLANAFICPWTENLFATKRGYVKHLRDLRETRMHRRAKQNRWQKKFEDFYNQPDFDSVIRWVELNPEFFFDHATKNGFGYNRHADKRNDFWIRITYLNLRWSDNLSNSHSCPRGGVQNWGRQPGKPDGYPGWGGSIEFQVSHSLGFGSDVFRNLGINTGTGGGISDNRYGFEVKFFASDWPKIYAQIAVEQDRFEKENLLKTIKTGYNTPYVVPGYQYGKPIYFKR